MSDPDLDRLARDRVTTALKTSGSALVAALAAAPAGSGHRPVPGLDWDVGTTTAHVLTVVRRALGDARRSATPEATADLNAQALTELAERRPHTLAGLLQRDLDRVITDVLPAWPDTAQVPFHGGTTVPLMHAYGALAMEIVVHTHDIARGLDIEPPSQPIAENLALDAFLALSPSWVDQARQTPVEATVRLTSGEDLQLRLDPGDLACRRFSGPAAPGTIVMSAMDLLLILTGRRDTDNTQLREIIAALRPL